tara:strand:- start:434 stop:598 length:165 start_codon:yes stop_codon:yes gene_type:complete
MTPQEKDELIERLTADLKMFHHSLDLKFDRKAANDQIESLLARIEKLESENREL